MLTGDRGRTSALALVAVLLLPPAAAVAGSAVVSGSAPVRSNSAGDCLAPGVPQLGVDAARACLAVRTAVPSWRGTAEVVLVDGDPAVAAEVVGRTVRVHPQPWQGLSPAGRQAVLTHELVHVATAALTTSRTPMWLTEGLAEAVAWRDVRELPDRLIAEELVAEVRAHRLPTSLPTEHDFATRPAQAYQGSWLAVDLLLGRLGPARLLRLYRDAGTMPWSRALQARPPAEAAPAGAQALVSAWRAELVRRLA